MADQETRERDDAGSTDAPAEKDTDTDGARDTTASEGSEGSGGSGGSSGTDDSSGDGGSSSDSSTTSETTTTSSGGSSPARRSENHAKPQAPSDSDREAQEANRRSFVGGSRSDDAEAPAGERRRASVDVGELVWKIANVLATVIRVVTLVFAVVLVADIALVVVGVNPANGVASFLRGFADTVVLGFRDLFLPADPTIALVVNYGVAAVFWVVVGGFLSAGIRFLAARIN